MMKYFNVGDQYNIEYYEESIHKYEIPSMWEI